MSFRILTGAVSPMQRNPSQDGLRLAFGLTLWTRPSHHAPDQRHLARVLTLLDQDVPHNPGPGGRSPARVIFVSVVL